VTVLICDFGQSQRTGLRPLTPGRQAVVYRCLEIILGEAEADYSFPINVWAAGTIFAEMLCGQQPLFSASCEIFGGRATRIKLQKDVLGGRATRIKLQKDVLGGRATRIKLPKDFLGGSATRFTWHTEA